MGFKLTNFMKKFSQLIFITVLVTAGFFNIALAKDLKPSDSSPASPKVEVKPVINNGQVIKNSLYDYEGKLANGHVLPSKPKYSWWEKLQIKIGNKTEEVYQSNSTAKFLLDHPYVPVIFGAAPLAVYAGAWVGGGYTAVTYASYIAVLKAAVVSSLISGIGIFTLDYLSGIETYGVLGSFKYAFNNISFNHYFPSMASAFYFSNFLQVLRLVKGYTIVKLISVAGLYASLNTLYIVLDKVANHEKIVMSDILISVSLSTLLLIIFRKNWEVNGRQSTSYIKQIFSSERAKRFWKEQIANALGEVISQSAKTIKNSLFKLFKK